MRPRVTTAVKITICILSIFYSFQISNAQNVGINATGEKAHSSAMLDVSSDKMGLLIPRVRLMNVALPTPIANPLYSMVVFNTNPGVVDGSGEGYYWNSSKIEGEALWIKLGSDGGNADNAWVLTGNAGTDATNFMGTIDPQPVIFKQHNEEAFRITEGGALLATGNSGTGVKPIPDFTNGSIMMYIPAQAAFRVGKIDFDSDAWNTNEIGNYSFATNINAKASGEGSAAFGSSTFANGSFSIAAGTNTKTDGTNAVAFGESAEALNSNAFAFGDHSIAYAPNSMAAGSYNNATGNSSIAAGILTQALGDFSFTMGEGTVANAVGGVSLGRFNVRYSATNAVTANCTDVIFQIGKGSGDADNFRQDALSLTRAGNLFVAGSVTSGLPVLCASDIRLKTGIKPLEKVLNNINNIQPITYYFKDKENYSNKHQIGFNAQELQKQFPELVSANDKGYLSVNYGQMSAVAIQAIKEQQQIIDQLKADLQKEREINNINEQKIKEHDLLIKELYNKIK